MRFQVSFKETDQRLKVQFNQSRNLLGVEFKEFQKATVESVERYDGDYNVTPATTPKTLATKEKFMVDDVTIQAIPFFEVSNTSGGNTVYIADEIYFE
jgi:hypothetical protein